MGRHVSDRLPVGRYNTPWTYEKGIKRESKPGKVIQAANVAVRYDDRLKIFYEKCKKRHGGKHVIAITRVANKMLRIICKMLTLKEPYKSHNAQLYGKKMKRMDNVQQSMRDVI